MPLFQRSFFKALRGGAVLVLAGTLLSGCLATRQEIEDLRVDIVRLQKTLTQVQSAQTDTRSDIRGGQADLQTEITSLNRNLEMLSAQLTENQNHMTMMAERMDDLDKNISHRLDALPAGNEKSKTSKPAPSILFNTAYGDLKRRKYDAALEGFQDYLKQYPETTKAAEAYYHMGEVHMAKREWAQAMAAFDEVLTRHPNHSIVPSAYMEKGVALERQDKLSAALAVYDAVVRKYPYRKEAQAAQTRIDALKQTASPAAVDR